MGKKGKLSPCFVGLLEILDRLHNLAYGLALPPTLLSVQNVFHGYFLRKYVTNLSYVLSYESLDVHKDLLYEEPLVKILHFEVKNLRTKAFNWLMYFGETMQLKNQHGKAKTKCMSNTLTFSVCLILKM